MSTELFRQYLNLLTEAVDLPQLTRSLTELETVLGKYQNKIYESVLEADLSDPPLFSPKPRITRLPGESADEYLARVRELSRSTTTPATTTPSTTTPAAPSQTTVGNRDRSTVVGNTPAQQAAQRAGMGTRAWAGNTPPVPAKQISVPGRIGTALKVIGGTVGLAYLAPKAWNLITDAYRSFIKYDFEDLAPGDQDTIKKNIAIIQPYYEEENFSQLPIKLQERLIKVAVQLGKLKSSLALPNNQLPLTRSQETDRAHKLNVNENSTTRDQMQQLNQLSSVEQMTVLKTLVSEGIYDDAVGAYDSAVGAVDSAISSVWNSDTLRYIGWPTAAYTTVGLATLGSIWRTWSKNYDEAMQTPTTPTSTKPVLGSAKLGAFKEFLSKSGSIKAKILRTILAKALGGLAATGIYTAAALKTGAEVAKDVGKWADNAEDRTAEQMIRRMSDLNSKGQFWDDNFISEEDRKKMLEVVIAHCNKNPQYQGCQEQKITLCGLIPGLKGCQQV